MHVVRFGFAIFLATSVLWGSLNALADGASQPTTATRGVEQVTVRLAQIDVVVRDKKGNIVSGLGPADFTVREDGSPVEIVAVDEWGRESVPPPPDTRANPTSGPPPAATSPVVPGSGSPQPPAAAVEAERRSFVIVFDALGESTALRMSQAKTAATNFVRTRMKAGDVGAVYQLDLTLRDVSGITSDPIALTKGISSIAWMPPSSLADQVNESVLAYTNNANKAVQGSRLAQQSAVVAGQLDWQREHVYQAITDLAAVFQGLPGKRVLVLASPGFPMTTTSDQRLQLGGFTPNFQKMLKTLATYGVTVYSIDLGSEITAGDASNVIDWRVAAGKLGMDENVLSDLGLERTLGTNTASSRRQFLGVIAAETGGRMLTDTNMNRSFTAVDEESSRFYRISCRVPVTADPNRYRSFKVTVNKDDYVVSTRRGRYSDVTPLEPSPGAGEKTTQVESLAGYKRLVTHGSASPIPAGSAPKIPVTVVLEALGPIDVTTDASGIGKVDVDVRIVARVADEVVARYERGITATLRKGVDSVRAGFRVEGRLDLVPGIYDVQGTVRLASPPQVGTWSGTVAVPPQSKSGAASILGPIVMADGESASPLLCQPSIDENSDPLTVKAGVRFLPASSSEFLVGSSVMAVFWLRDFAPAGAPPPSLEMSVKLLQAAGTPAQAASQLVYFGPSPAGGFVVVARVDSSKLPPGTYLVEVSATPPGGGAPITRRSAPLTLNPRDASPASAAATSSAP